MFFITKSVYLILDVLHYKKYLKLKKSYKSIKVARKSQGMRHHQVVGFWKNQ